MRGDILNYVSTISHVIHPHAYIQAWRSCDLGIPMREVSGAVDLSLANMEDLILTTE